MNHNLEVPAKIIEAIKAKKLLIFVGAGMSRRFDLPDWEKMAIDVIQKTPLPEYAGYVSVLKDKLFEPLAVLDKIEREKRDVYAYIENNFIVDKSQDLETHKNLIKISGKIVTTNYDNAFEVAKEGIYAVPHNSVFKISNITDKNEYVFKMHGSASHDASDCIVFSKDYEELYSGNSAAIFKMKELFINNTILFIGFGFADPYVNKLFSTMDNLFEGNHTHYLLTTTPDKFASLKYIKSIELKEYSQIDEFISMCLPSLDYDKSKIAIEKVADNQHKISSVRKLAVLYPKCIDLAEFKHAKTLLNCFENLEANLYKGFLNLKALQELDDYDMVFIITASYKGKLYIEGEDIKSQLISVEELSSAILNDKMPRVIISDSFVDISTLNNTASIAGYKNEVLNKFLYKILRNGENQFVSENVRMGSFLNKHVFNKSKSTNKLLYKVHAYTNYSAKATEDLIGRIEEQASIARKLISIRESRKILTIKGAGGTGKTTLAKKISYALHERGYFDDGVVFTSCEQVSGFKTFEAILINAFKLNNVTDFKKHMQDNACEVDMLIILDNFETVTSLSNEVDLKEIYKLLEFVTDYAHVVLTSREVLDEDFEDVFTLSSMITDDAVKLFEQCYQNVLEEEMPILRHDILENMLNNNPLAIKIVTKNSLKQQSIIYLKEQLIDSFFESTSLDFERAFNKKADINIERTKSIFQSINYSYCKLSTKEKLAFEILHLFPDGIDISDFKTGFNKKGVANKISDSDLRSLNNKSLIESNDGILQLQPIVRRFAEFQFNKKTAEVKKQYYSDAYDYNSYLLSYLDEVHFKNTNTSMKYYNLFKNNLFLALDYIPQINVVEKDAFTKQHLLNYTLNLVTYFLDKQQETGMLKKLPELYDYFNDIPYSKEVLKTYSEVMVYYSLNFDDTYHNLCKLFKSEEIVNRAISSEHENEARYKNRISIIHSMEGYTIQYIESFVKNKELAKSNNINTHLFYLGVHSHTMELSSDFHTFERDYAHNRLDIPSLEKYIKSIFAEYHLERMQTTYILSKVKSLSKEEIKKLVVTNPYSAGLKELMFAFNSDDNTEIENHFNSALNNLQHIKYYYLDALYYYCKFLYKSENSRFEQIYSEGLSFCQTYHYQYLEHRFRSIKLLEKKTYVCDYSYYPILGLQSFVDWYIPTYNKVTAKRLKQSNY